MDNRVPTTSTQNRGRSQAASASRSRAAGASRSQTRQAGASPLQGQRTYTAKRAGGSAREAQPLSTRTQTRTREVRTHTSSDASKNTGFFTQPAVRYIVLPLLAAGAFIAVGVLVSCAGGFDVL